MKVLVFGASGKTGREVIRQALPMGHDVTAFVRDPRRLDTTDPHMRTVVGEMTSADAGVTEAVRGQDAVICTLGVRTLRSGGLIEQSMRLIVPAMEREGVRRLLIVSAFGVGDTLRGASLPQRLLYGTLLRSIYADKRAGEDIVARSSLDWTVVYPVLLTDGPRSAQYRSGVLLPMAGVPKVSRANVADLLLKQLDDQAYIRRGVVISE